MTKTPFIRATEIWIPAKDRRSLEWSAGVYGPLKEFELASKSMTFAYDEGLPGKAWSECRPIVLKDLQNSYFKRGALTGAAGITCGVAVPIFCGPVLTAVLVLFCGDDADHVGAIELWRAGEDEYELGFHDGYFGTAESFEFDARYVKFPRGQGLPGLVWERGGPVVLDDLGVSKRFIRRKSAAESGINRGVGLPCGRDGDGTWVLTLLSALGTPIAKRFEIWRPDARAERLRFDEGLCESVGDLKADYRYATVPLMQGALGQLLLSGVPQIATDLSQEAPEIAASVSKADLTCMVATPVFRDGRLEAVTAWYL